jgi:hypothetical protein
MVTQIMIDQNPVSVPVKIFTRTENPVPVPVPVKHGISVLAKSSVQMCTKILKIFLKILLYFILVKIFK